MMALRILRIASSIAIVLVVAGCEDETKPLVYFGSVDGFCSSLIEHLIEIDVRCVGGPEEYHRRRLAMTLAPNLCQEINGAVEAGHLRIDEARALECFRLLETGDCGDWYDPERSRDGEPVGPIEAACYGMFVGGRLEGESCDSAPSSFCGPGLFCDDCTRVCRPLLSAGQPCGSDLHCEPGLACAIDGICDRLGRLGSACTDAGCEQGAICDREQCRPFREENESCDPTSVGASCGGALHCIPAGIGLEGVCLPLVGVGEPCIDQQCRYPSFCQQGVCALRPVLGEPCAEYSCIEGVCIDAVCSEPRDIGEPCEPYQCGDGWCDRGVCAEAIPAGGACTSWEQCGPEAYCFDGTCGTFEETLCE